MGPSKPSLGEQLNQKGSHFRPHFGPLFRSRFSKKMRSLSNGMLQNVAIWILKAPQNGGRIGTPKNLSKGISGNLGTPRGLPKWRPLGLYFMPQHGPSWGLRFWAPNRFFMIWGGASWSRIWAGFQNQYGHFRKHSVETERSVFLKIGFGRGVQIEANLRRLKAAFPQKLPFYVRGPSKNANSLKKSSPASSPGQPSQRRPGAPRPAQPATPWSSILIDFQTIFGRDFG